MERFFFVHIHFCAYRNSFEPEKPDACIFFEFSKINESIIMSLHKYTEYLMRCLIFCLFLQAPPNALINYTSIKHLSNNLESSTLEINLLVTHSFFNNSRARLKVSACAFKFNSIQLEHLMHTHFGRSGKMNARDTYIDKS